MKRTTSDSIVTVVGAGLTIFFIVAGSLGLWAYSFANSNVHNQLAEQQITFPPAAAFTHTVVGTEITPSMVPAVSQYAGQQLTAGKQVETYADNFTAVHPRRSAAPRPMRSCRLGQWRCQRGLHST
jgi:hypothetical protein